jgi:glutamate racemase
LVLRKYLRPFKDKKIDYLILGCTHYPFLEKAIKKNLGKKTRILSAPQAVAEKLAGYLRRHPEIESKLSKNGQTQIFCTGNKKAFGKWAGELIDGGFLIRQID